MVFFNALHAIPNLFFTFFAFDAQHHFFLYVQNIGNVTKMEAICNITFLLLSHQQMSHSATVMARGDLINEKVDLISPSVILCCRCLASVTRSSKFFTML